MCLKTCEMDMCVMQMISEWDVSWTAVVLRWRGLARRGVCRTWASVGDRRLAWAWHVALHGLANSQWINDTHLVSSRYEELSDRVIFYCQFVLLWAQRRLSAGGGGRVLGAGALRCNCCSNNLEVLWLWCNITVQRYDNAQHFYLRAPMKIANEIGRQINLRITLTISIY